MPRVVGILLLSFFSLYAKESSAPADSVASESSKMTLSEYLAWPFSHVIQPALNVLVFPFSAPIHYAVKNNVIETGVDAITFGKDRNIFVYPTFNLRPGATTMMGFAYRHRNMLLAKDYFVFTAGSLPIATWILPRVTRSAMCLARSFFSGTLRPGNG